MPSYQGRLHLGLNIGTQHLVLDFVRVVEAFVTGDPARPPSPIPYYGKISNPLHVAKTLLYGVQTLLGDAVLVSHLAPALVHNFKRLPPDLAMLHGKR
jgi:hypothetical protein